MTKYDPVEKDSQDVYKSVWNILKHCEKHIGMNGYKCDCQYFDENNINDWEFDEWCLLHAPYFWDIDAINRASKEGGDAR